MFTVEIMINGTMVGHIYGHNEKDLGGDVCEYRYEYYRPEMRKVVNGRVNHLGSNGIEELISLILTDFQKKRRVMMKRATKSS